MKQQEINTLLEAYYNGTISQENRRRLELYAMDDPFLYEALEGGKSREITPMDSVRTRLHQRVKPAKRRVLWLPAVAACVLLISAVFLWNQYGSIDEVALAENTSVPAKEKFLDESPLEKLPATMDSEQEPIVEQKIKQTKKGKTKKETPENKDKRNVASNTENEITPPPPAAAEEAIYEDAVIVGDLNTEYNPERNERAKVSEKEVLANVEDEIGLDVKEEVAEAENVEAEMIPTARTTDGASAQKARKKASTSWDNVGAEEVMSTVTRKIRGVVKDEQGIELIGANVNIEGSQAGTMTDIDGQFTINVNKENTEISINYTGYKSEIIALSLDSFYTITMREAALLNEVVVTAYGNSSAVPDMGWQAFNAYIENNKQRTPQAEKDNITGVVRLAFDIDSEGKPINFEVLDTPGNGLEQKAIQLIINSGKWSQGQVIYEIVY